MEIFTIKEYDNLIDGIVSLRKDTIEKNSIEYLHDKTIYEANRKYCEEKILLYISECEYIRYLKEEIDIQSTLILNKFNGKIHVLSFMDYMSTILTDKEINRLRFILSNYINNFDKIVYSILNSLKELCGKEYRFKSPSLHDKDILDIIDYMIIINGDKNKDIFLYSIE